MHRLRNALDLFCLSILTIALPPQVHNFQIASPYKDFFRKFINTQKGLLL